MSLFRCGGGANGGKISSFVATLVTSGSGATTTDPTFTFSGLTVGTTYLVRIVLASTLTSYDVSSSGYEVIGDLYFPESARSDNNRIWEKIIVPTASTITIKIHEGSASAKSYWVYELTAN